MSLPLWVIEPCFGLSKRATAFNVVDLQQPFGPINAITLFFGNFIDRFLTTSLS